MKYHCFKTISLVFCLLISIAVLPQQIGVKTGINYAKIGYEGTDAPLKNALMVYRQSTLYGGFLNFKLAPLVSLQLEGNYDPRGMQMEIPSYEGEGMFEGDEYQAIDYVTIPLLVKVKLLVFFVEGGPYAGFLIKAKEVRNGTLTKTSETGFVVSDYYSEIDNKEYWSTVDYGLVLGGGLSFKLGPVEVMGGARYNAGIANIIKDKDLDLQARNKVMSVYAGLGLRF
jgi:hypothetical protein